MPIKLKLYAVTVQDTDKPAVKLLVTSMCKGKKGKQSVRFQVQNAGVPASAIADVKRAKLNAKS